MIHGEYDRLRTTLTTALRAAGLERVAEIDGPNRLGGFRIGDGDYCVALSLVPPRKKDDRDAGRHWWVSAWMPVSDGYESLLSPDLIAVPHRREVMLKKPLTAEDATVAAIQMLIELRVRAALSRPVIAVAEPRTEEPARQTFTAMPATSPNVFRTAPNPVAVRETADATR